MAWPAPHYRTAMAGRAAGAAAFAPLNGWPEREPRQAVGDLAISRTRPEDLLADCVSRQSPELVRRIGFGGGRRTSGADQDVYWGPEHCSGATSATKRVGRVEKTMGVVSEDDAMGLHTAS